MFSAGTMASAGLKDLAENGGTAMLAAELSGMSGVADIAMTDPPSLLGPGAPRC